MSGQLEQPQDAYDGEELEYLGVVEPVGQRALQHGVRVEAERGHEVDDVHGRLGEVHEIRRHLRHRARGYRRQKNDGSGTGRARGERVKWLVGWVGVGRRVR